MVIRLITLAPYTFITQCISELCKHFFTDSWFSGSEVQRLCAKGNWGLHTETHLCVPSANIQHGGVVGFCDKSAHLNVADTVVDTQERLSPKLCDCTSHQSHRHQGGTHTRTCGRRSKWNCPFRVIADIRSVFEEEKYICQFVVALQPLMNYHKVMSQDLVLPLVYEIQSMSAGFSPACSSASLRTVSTTARWCLAVSLGMNPDG